VLDADSSGVLTLEAGSRIPKKRNALDAILGKLRAAHIAGQLETTFTSPIDRQETVLSLVFSWRHILVDNMNEFSEWTIALVQGSIE